jgi:hypothetical protein
MLSSTSSSDRAARWRCGWIGLLLLVVALLAVGEIVCRTLVPRGIESEARRQQERADAIAVRPGMEGSLSVLLLGNSLLAEGADIAKLRRRVGRDVSVTRFQVEGTTYYDWLFGIRRLLKAGSRPDIIALVLSPDQLASAGHRGDYSAYLLLDSADAWMAGSEIGLSNTQTADLVISHSSALFGMRTSIRKRALQVLVPGLDRVMPLLTARPEPALQAGQVEALARDRLAILRSTVEAYGVRFVLIVPPTNDIHAAELAAAVVRGGQASATRVLLPVAPGTLARESFQEDGFHLSRLGSDIFTPRLADELLRIAGKS